MKKRNFKMKAAIVLCGLVIIFLLTIMSSSFYTGVLNKNSMGNAGEEEKKAHYVMLVENTDSTFWKSVYESAKKKADAEDVILELSRNTDAVPYSCAERMEMYIAARVDGIILEYRGETELDEQIAMALDAKIPVVTVLNDAAKKGSISFVGVNNYQLAEEYGKQIVKILTPEMKKITVLTHNSKENEGEEQVYNQINNMVINSEKATDNITMETKRIPSAGAFDAEEAIWSIFQNREEIPDILVCFNEVDTECAYQALINYNLVGKVQIVGYYYTDMILDAIKQGIIPVTIDLNTEQMGRYSIQALTEYEKDGYVNSFFNVDLKVIDKEKAGEMLNHGKEKME